MNGEYGADDPIPPVVNAEATTSQSAFTWGSEQPVLAASDMDADEPEPAEDVIRRWQPRVGEPVVTEDDAWAGDPRLPKAEVARVVRGLTTRDRALLELLGEHHYLTTDDVEALLFPNLRDTQNRLLRFRPPIAKRDRHGSVVRLRNEDGLGLVMRWSRASAGPWHKLSAVWLLRQKGAIVLAEIRREDAEGTHQLVRRSYNAATFTAKLSHDLGAIGLFTSLVRESRGLAHQGLHSWVGEEGMRRRYHRKTAQGEGETKPPAISPDGWGRYLAGGQEIAFHLEWDEGTEPPPTLTAKAKGYGDHYAKYGTGVRNHVLWVANNSLRERSLREAVSRSNPKLEDVTHWTTEATQLRAKGGLGVVWRALSGSGAAVALADLPGRQAAPELRVAECLGKPGWWERG